MERKRQKRNVVLESRLVPIYGEVGAGRVIPFVPRDEVIPVAVPKGIKDEHIGTSIVRGCSLEDEGIFDGDILIWRRDFTHYDISDNTICIIFVQATGELVAKKLAFGNNGTIRLIASGGGIKDIYYPRDDIEVRALVIGFQRMLKKDRHKDPSIPF